MPRASLLPTAHCPILALPKEDSGEICRERSCPEARMEMQAGFAS